MPRSTGDLVVDTLRRPPGLQHLELDLLHSPKGAPPTFQLRSLRFGNHITRSLATFLTKSSTHTLVNISVTLEDDRDDPAWSILRTFTNLTRLHLDFVRRPLVSLPLDAFTFLEHLSFGSFVDCRDIRRLKPSDSPHHLVIRWPPSLQSLTTYSHICYTPTIILDFLGSTKSPRLRRICLKIAGLDGCWSVQEQQEVRDACARRGVAVMTLSQGRGRLAA